MAEGIVIRIDTLGETDINHRLLRFATRAGGAAPALELIHEYLAGVAAAQFSSAGAASGHPWAPLLQVTVDRKNRSKDPLTKGNAGRILEASGRLKDSLTRAGDPNMVHVVTHDTMIYGTKLKYGQEHQKPEAGKTQRKPVDLTLRNKAVMIKTLQLWITRGVARLQGPMG